MGNLKDYRKHELLWYIIACIIIAVFAYNPTVFELKNTENIFNRISSIASSALMLGVISIFAYVIDGLFAGNLKEVLLYLFFNCLPGKTVFSRINKGKIKDERIDLKKARFAYKNIIANATKIKEELKRRSYENTEWYAMYKRHKEVDSSIFATHRDFLLYRDLYIITLSMLLITLVIMLSPLLAFNWYVVSYLLIMLVFTNLATRNKAHRFVNTVIAADLADFPN